MDQCIEALDCEDNLQVVDLKNLPKILDDDEINVFDMTSLGTLLLLGQTTGKVEPKECGPIDEDIHLHRLSLAYERLHTIPKLLVEEFAPHVRILDISCNEIEDLECLSTFKDLTHLICDHNNITSKTAVPFLPKLELLWLNHCKICELYPWAKRLQRSCPNIKYLSLMGNPVAPSYLNGGSFCEYLEYRFSIISIFPKLIHLDDNAVTADQRTEAQRMYHRPLVERLVSKTHQNLPTYLRIMSERVSEILYPNPAGTAQKNSIV